MVVHNQLMESIHDCFAMPDWDPKAKVDTYLVDIKEELVGLKYLNDSIHHSFPINSLNYQLFSHYSDAYYFKTKSGEEGLLRHINEKNEKLI